MEKDKKSLEGKGVCVGTNSIISVELETAVESIITSSFFSDENINIFYSPIMNKGALENYERSVINRKDFNGNNNEYILKSIVNKEINYGIWAVNDGKNKGLNKAQFNKIKPNDIIIFIAKENNYQTIVSIGIIDKTTVNPDVSKKLFNNSEYRNIIFIKKIIVLKKPFRLSKKRKGVATLDGVPNWIWHNSYDMFRQWNFFEKINKNKFSHYKPLLEEEFIELLIKECGGDILYDVYDERLNYNGEDENYLFSSESALTLCNENNSNESNINNIEDINIDKLIKSEVKFKNGIKDKSKKSSLRTKRNINNKNNGNEDCDNKLSITQRKYLGWIGEKLIFERLNNKNIELLEQLYIDTNEEYEVEWFNKEVDLSDNWIDQSIGNGCDIIVRNRNRIIYLEVKTSYKKGYLLTLTGNEIRKASDYREDYFLIIIDNIESYERNEIVSTIINDPIKNFVFNNFINNTKIITMYR